MNFCQVLIILTFFLCKVGKPDPKPDGFYRVETYLFKNDKEIFMNQVDTQHKSWLKESFG